MFKSTYKDFRNKSGLAVGDKVKIKSNPKGHQVRVTTGKVTSIPSDVTFVVDNGMWNESFCFIDINRPGGITLKVI